MLELQAGQREAVERQREAEEKQARRHSAELDALEARLEAKLLAIHLPRGWKGAVPDTANDGGAVGSAVFNEAYGAREIYAQPAARRRPRDVSSFRISLRDAMQLGSAQPSALVAKKKPRGRFMSSLIRKTMLEEYVTSMTEPALLEANPTSSPAPNSILRFPPTVYPTQRAPSHALTMNDTLLVTRHDTCTDSQPTMIAPKAPLNYASGHNSL
jgi:hypothetical protein